MKHLKSFKEEIDLSQYDEVEPGKFVPKNTRHQEVYPSTYELTTSEILDIVHSFSGATIPIEAIEEEMERYEDKKINK